MVGLGPQGPVPGVCAGTRRVVLEKMRAFAQTTFIVEGLDVRIPIRVGEPNVRMDALVRSYGCDRWSHLTAYNPGGQQRDLCWNRRAHARLLTVLHRRWWLPGVGVPDMGSWEPEPGVFLFGMSLHEVGVLGRQFEQAAVVHSFLGGRPRLVPLNG